jgi:hypothetical protein
VIEFEVKQLSDTQPGVTQHGDSDPGEVVIETVHRSHEGGIDVGWKSARQRVGLAGDVGIEHQPSSWCVGPVPGRDVIEERAHGDGGVGVHVGPDGSGPVVAASAGPHRGPGQERFDVAAFEAGDRAELGVVPADELTEDGQAAGELLDGLGPQHRGPHLDVGEQRPADLA